MNNYIWEYYQGIVDGSIVVGKWIRKLYELVIHGLDAGEFFFDQKKANRAINFIESFVRHSKGVLAPELIKLSLWQKATLSLMFGIVDENGRRQYDQVFLVVGRKCGKTTFAYGIILYMAFVAGEFGSEIYCIAPKLDQSDLVYSGFEFNVEKNSSFLKIAKKRKSDWYIKSTNTSIKKVAFNEKQADGYSPMLSVLDEMSSWPAVRGKKQYEVMTSGTCARLEPITLSISSGGYVNEGPFDELMLRGTRYLNGDSREKKLLPIIYMIDDFDKWDDINELRKSLPGLGVSISVDKILNEINTAHESLSKRSEFLTKYCNLKQNSSSAFLSAQTVKKACGPELKLEDFKSSYAVVGIDLSQAVDLTSACVVIEKDGITHVISHFWLPTSKLETAEANDGLPYSEFIKKGWLSLSGEGFIDYNDVYDWVCNLVSEWEILPLVVGYDRYSAQYLVSDLKNAGFKCDDVYQGFNLTPAINELEGKMESGLIRIGNNDLLKVHLLDVAVNQDAESRRKKIVKLNSRAHIDGVAALLCALIVRQKWSSEISEQLKNED